MINRPLLLMITCIGFFIIIQSFVPKVMAMKSSNIGEFTLEDQNTRKRKNYVVQFSRDTDTFGSINNIGPTYDMGTSYGIEPLVANTNPEELSALLGDYADMIRNDVISLDNSVQTRTSKRGNIKVEKHNQAISDPPCTCKYSIEKKDFGIHSFPRVVEIRSCSKEQQNNCTPPYVCRENMYNILVMRRRINPSQPSLEVPGELKYRYIAEKQSISVGCVCTNEYLD